MINLFQTFKKCKKLNNIINFNRNFTINPNFYINNTELLKNQILNINSQLKELSLSI